MAPRSSNRTPHRLRPFLVTCLLLLPILARADSGYVSASDLARTLGMEYTDLSGGSIHAARLAGGGREATLYAGMSSIVLDGNRIAISRAIRWDGSALLAPADLARVIQSGAAPAAESGSAPAPSNTPAPLRPVPMRPRNSAFRVVIDAGHGHPDTGAIGRSGLREKDVNLDVARKTGAYLENRGVTVIYTRRSDILVPLEERAEIANRARADLFVSVHANSNPDRSFTGALTIYPDDGVRDGRPDLHGRAEKAVESSAVRPETLGAGGPVGKAALLAVVDAAFESYRIQAMDAAHCIERAVVPVAGRCEQHNGIMEDIRGLRVLRETHIPAVLVEVDFLSNRTSEQKLARASYRTSLAEAIGEGILNYLRHTESEE